MPPTNEAERMLFVIAKGIFQVVEFADFKGGAFVSQITERTSPVHSLNMMISSDVMDDEERACIEMALQYVIELRNLSLSTKPSRIFNVFSATKNALDMLWCVFKKDLAPREVQMKQFAHRSRKVSGSSTVLIDKAASAKDNTTPANARVENSKATTRGSAPSTIQDTFVVHLIDLSGRKISVQGVVSFEGKCDLGPALHGTMLTSTVATGPRDGRKGSMESSSAESFSHDEHDIFSGGGVKLESP